MPVDPLNHPVPIVRQVKHRGMAGTVIGYSHPSQTRRCGGLATRDGDDGAESGKIPCSANARLAPEIDSNAGIARTRAELVADREGLRCREQRLVQDNGCFQHCSGQSQETGDQVARRIGDAASSR